jgi:hypothetical protein
MQKWDKNIVKKTILSLEGDFTAIDVAVKKTKGKKDMVRDNFWEYQVGLSDLKEILEELVTERFLVKSFTSEVGKTITMYKLSENL